MQIVKNRRPILEHFLRRGSDLVRKKKELDWNIAVAVADVESVRLRVGTEGIGRETALERKEDHTVEVGREVSSDVAAEVIGECRRRTARLQHEGNGILMACVLGVASALQGPLHTRLLAVLRKLLHRAQVRVLSH